MEKVSIRREPLPELEAIYFLSPTEESIDFLIKDFENSKKPQYAAVHLFLTSRNLSHEPKVTNRFTARTLNKAQGIQCDQMGETIQRTEP